METGGRWVYQYTNEAFPKISKNTKNHEKIPKEFCLGNAFLRVDHLKVWKRILVTTTHHKQRKAEFFPGGGAGVGPIA